MYRFAPAALAAAVLVASPSAAAQTPGTTDGGAQPTACPPAGATAAAVEDSSDGGPTTSDESELGGSGTTTFASETSGSAGGATVPVADDLADVQGSAAQEPQPTPEQPGQQQPGGQPSPPQGQPQPGAPQEQPGAEQPAGGGGALPRTGLDALRLAALGVLLLLVGARLRVRARTRKTRSGVARVDAGPTAGSPAAGGHLEEDLRGSLERLRGPEEDWQFPDRDPAPTGLLPSTASARRAARLAEPDPAVPG
jgi:hypothetical protein